jgi:hypothetical protein
LDGSEGFFFDVLFKMESPAPKRRHRIKCNDRLAPSPLIQRP